MAAILYVSCAPLVSFTRENQGASFQVLHRRSGASGIWRAPTTAAGHVTYRTIGVSVTAEKLNSLMSSGGGCGRVSEFVARPQNVSQSTALELERPRAHRQVRVECERLCCVAR
jgi:hypothetical protein